MPNVGMAIEPIFPFENFSSTPQIMNQGLKPQDLAFHPLDDRIYAESDYLLVEFTSGHYLFGNFFQVKVGPIKKYGASASIITPEGERFFLKSEVKRKDFKTSTIECSHQAGPNFIRGAYPDFVVHLEGLDLSAHLQIHDLVRGWRPGSGRVYFGEERKKFYDFSVPHPRARISGKIRLGSKKEIEASGMAYSDHTYANILSTDQAVNWYSLRTFGSKYSANYLEFVTPPKYGSVRVPWLMITDNQQILYATTHVEMRASDYISDKDSGYSYPQMLDLSVNEEGFSLEGTIQNQRIVERFDIFSDLPYLIRITAKAFLHRPIIFRFMGDYKMDFYIAPREGQREIKDSLSGRGISEVVFVK